MNKFSSLALILCVVLAATGCSGESERAGGDTSERSPTSEKPAPDTTRQDAPETTMERASRPEKTEEKAQKPDPFAEYAKFTIEGLQDREYGEGNIEVLQTLEENTAFTRYLVSYPSDELTITGMLNVPVGEGPFRPVILNHGYYPIEVYKTGDGSTLAADYLASSGFITLSPDFRSHAGSTDAPNQFRAGHVIDALNAIEPLQKLPEAADVDVGMWGHSNGGAITAKAITVSGKIGAALIYAPASSNIPQDYAFRVDRAAERGEEIDPIEWPVKPEESPDLYRRLSPLPYLENVEAPVQIHWGTADETVPREWPGDLHDGLVGADKRSTFFEYPGQPHSLYGADNELYLQRTAEFFDANL